MNSLEQFVMAPKRDRRRSVPADWKEQLAAIPGVAIQGVASERVQFAAEARAMEHVRSRFGDDFVIEELMQRRPPDG